MVFTHFIDATAAAGCDGIIIIMIVSIHSD